MQGGLQPTVTEMVTRIEAIADEADLSEDIESLFEKPSDFLKRLEQMDLDEDGTILVAGARNDIRIATRMLEERKEERDRESEDDTDWSMISTTQSEKLAQPEASPNAAVRSVFDDVDK